MKKQLIALVGSCVLGFSLVACSQSSPGSDGGVEEKADTTTEQDTENSEPVPVHAEADKYTGTVPNFVGQNVAQIGHWNGSMIVVPVGHSGLYIRVVASDGSLVTEDNAEQYRVVSQEPTGGTTYEVTYMLREDGTEYDNLVDAQGIEEVTVNVEPVEK